MAKEVVQTELKKGKASFTLTGKAKINQYTFKLGNTYESGWTDNKMNLGVDCGDGNVVYAELSGGYFPDKDSAVYAHGYTESDGKRTDDYKNRLTIDWDDRLDEDVLDSVGEGSFLKMGIVMDGNDLDIKKFLSGYDAVEYLQSVLENDMDIVVKGNIKYSGVEQTYIKKEITHIYLNNKKAAPKAEFTQTILLDSGSIDKKIDEEKKTIGINAYVVDYVGKHKDKDSKQQFEIKKNVVFPVRFEMDLSEKPEIMSKMLKKYFQVTKKDAITELVVEGKLVESQNAVTITADDIPEDIKELIELGIYSEEEAMAKCAVGNNNKRDRRMVITRPAIITVGQGEDRKQSISIDPVKYKETDKVFLQAILNEMGGFVDTGSGSADEEAEEDFLAALADL